MRGYRSTIGLGVPVEGLAVMLEDMFEAMGGRTWYIDLWSYNPLFARWRVFFENAGVWTFLEQNYVPPPTGP